MQTGADRMAAELDKVQFQAAATTGLLERDRRSRTRMPASIKQLLVEQIVKPVRWEQTMQTLVADEARRGSSSWRPAARWPGLLKRINRRLPVESARDGRCADAATRHSRVTAATRT